MYIQTSMHDRKEFSKILTRELSKNFTNAVKSSERFYVNSTGDFEKIVKLYKLKIVDYKSRLIGANQVLIFRSDGKLEVEGLTQFGGEPDVLKFLRVFKNYFGSMDVIKDSMYRTYYASSQKNLDQFSSHLYKNFNISSDIIGSDLVGTFGKILFIATRTPFSEQISLKFKTKFFKDAK